MNVGRRGPSVRRVFLTGVVILLPVFISIWVIRFLFTQVDGAVTPWVESLLRVSGFGWLLAQGWVDYITPVVSIVLSMLAIYIVGLFGGNVIGRQILAWVDKVLLAVPLLRGIYSATRQFIDTFSKDKGAFRKVVMVEYPRRGVWSLGFLTNELEGELRSASGQEAHSSVFLPTTPNPTSGWMAFIPKKEIIELSISIDDAFKMIISGGVLMPGAGAGPRALPIDEITNVSIVSKRPKN